MAYDFNGTNQYLTTASTPVTAVPLTMACWFNPDNTTIGVLMQISDGSLVSRFGLAAMGIGLSNRIGTYAIESGVDGRVDTTTAYSTGVWQHACGVFTTNSSRTSYLNAGGSATSAVSVTPLGVNIFEIGGRTNGGVAGVLLNGQIAEVGIWNAALTAAEVASLAKGMTCDKVRPQSLVFYAPLIRTAQDLARGLTITNNNGATVANHPRVYA